MVLDEGEDKKIQAAIDAAVLEKFEGKPPGKVQDWGVREGDDVEFDASYGKLYINPHATEDSRPATKIKRKGKLEDVREEDAIIYAGCHVAIFVEAYAYLGSKKESIKPGATLGLIAVMFIKDGEPLGKITASPEEGFEGFDTEEPEDDFENEL